MTSIRLSRPKRPSRLRSRILTLSDPWVGPRLLFMGWLLALCVLTVVPSQWVVSVSAKEEEAWFDLAQAQAERITQAYCAAVDPGKVTSGTEPAALALLRQNPLNLAVADPGSGAIWVRDGERLRPMGPGAETETLLKWSAMAKASGKMTWSPEGWSRLQESGSFTFVPKHSGVVVIKRWTPGSPEVEEFMEQVLSGYMPVRFGVVLTRKTEATGRSVSRPESRSCALQVADLTGPAPFRRAPVQKQRFGDWFMPVVRMPESVYREQLRVRRLRATIAWGIYAFWAFFSGGMLLLQVQAQSRKQMDAKRLAALAHSLKTPLALMKMRCDSALNANLSGERQVAHLMRVGDGVEKLLHIIEHGLEPFRPQGPAQRAPVIPETFFQELEADFAPAFEELDRTLVVEPGKGTIRATASSLRSAASILVENALLHGFGTVRLTSRKGAHGTVIQVHDEGSGIMKDRLAMLQDPGGKSPEAVPTAIGTSQGLGLDLLTSLARREG